MSDNVLDMYEHVAMSNAGITTDELDTKVQELVAYREAYEVKKKESSDAYAAYNKTQFELLEMLTNCGKSKYIAEGLGTVSKVMKKSTQVPKDIEAKRDMLGYFKELGEIEYLNFVSVNSMTLNSYINSKLEEDPDFTIPGVGPQKITEELRFTKARSKK